MKKDQFQLEISYSNASSNGPFGSSYEKAFLTIYFGYKQSIYLQSVLIKLLHQSSFGSFHIYITSAFLFT